ncbi:MAG: type II toxin-antitoxin system VapC family toxin [Anaerolineae bacterium]|nr:type II toxin-antitoxin system VapC family toxin [Candidatus Roseilinea sp.]MDW8450022.1 type II toxin-antitoxin system VapC family toxin [Anaerolineae bacterium]
MESIRLCLDSSLLIGYLRNREPEASATVHALRRYPCYVASITVYEILFGAARARRQIDENKLLAPFVVLPLDEKSARLAAHLHDGLIRQNADIGIKDVLIAAICLSHGVALLTANYEHFRRVSPLHVLRPDEILTSDHPSDL